tara:strand:- start:537 stop:806 length:270 start_codon:yes stop_codon:yes gene_type:complete
MWKNEKKGFIEVDILKLKGVDIVHDLNYTPYPFENNVADEISMNNVLEHINNTFRVIDELYRIGKNKCIINIAVPYFIDSFCYIQTIYL